MKNLVQKQKDYFYSGITRPYSFRKQQLEKLQKMLEKNESQIYEALKIDLNKSKHEALTTELGILYTEISFCLKHLKDWMKDEQVDAPLTHQGTKNYIMYEPYGTTLIIAPWNYPVQLALAPVIGAIAAGNTMVLKPSELTPHTSKVIKQMVEETFDKDYFTVVEGDKEVSEQLLEQRFDYIFFTGSTAVGKIVMEKASKHLIPITLELGGKSPAIIDKNCHIKHTAKRIVWGKLTNAGQTCVAPDYVYIHESVKNKMVKAMIKQIRSLYSKKPLENDQYVKIVNEGHFNRLVRLLENGSILHGGKYDRKTLKIEPTIIDGLTWDDPIMQEEIFGPIMPIFTFNKLSEVVSVVRENEKPLALYYFGKSEKREQEILQTLSFGGACVNDTLYHLANPNLPFGGVGYSGKGAYHGKYSFETFSHRKSVMKQTTLFDFPVRYPGSKMSHAIAKRLLK